MSEEDAADTWWGTLPPKRRVQIHRWIVTPDDLGEIPGQLDLLEKRGPDSASPQT